VALLFEEESCRILGACFEVYKERGCGFLGPVYQECLVIEFEIQGIPFEKQVELVVNYKVALWCNVTSPILFVSARLLSRSSQFQV